MKKQYTKKQITEAIAYWQKQLNEAEQLNEGFLGGLLGAAIAGTIVDIGLPSVVLLGCLYGGHKIQQYFQKRSAVKNLNDQELALLAALQEAGVSGIASKDLQTVANKTNTDVKETTNLLDKLVSLELADQKNEKYFINMKGKKILKDAGYNPYAVEKDAKSLEQNAKLYEARHDGKWLPKHPTHRNPTDKPTVYYLGVDDSDDFCEYGSYIMPNGGLTHGASNNDFKSAAVTKVPASLRGMIDKAVAKYGSDKYIFVFKEEYSYGNWTHKSHARPSVIDVWYPNGQYWRYGLAEVNALQENDMLKGKPHNNHLNESDNFNKAEHLAIECASNPDFSGDFFKSYTEEEMRDVGIDMSKEGPTGWMSYIFGHMFSDTNEWTTALEDSVLLDNVKKITLSLDGNLVTIEKKH